MKNKFLKFSLVIATATTIGIISCENENTSNEASQEVTNQNVKTPSGIISIEKATQNFNNFYNNRIVPLKNNLGENQNRSIWLNKELLINYLDKIENVSTEKGIPLSGVNFIFATDKNKRQSIFLMPTIFISDANYHKSFSINNGKIFYLNQIKDKIDIDNTISNNLSESLILEPQKGNLGNVDAIKMFNQYFETSIMPFKDILDFDTKAVWYSVQQLREYLNYVETKTQNINISGFEIVFSAYSNDQVLGLKQNKTTLFLAPTIHDSSTNKHMAFTILEGNINYINLNTNLMNVNEIRKSSNSNETSLLLNRGQANPPPSDVIDPNS